MDDNTQSPATEETVADQTVETQAEEAEWTPPSFASLMETSDKEADTDLASILGLPRDEAIPVGDNQGEQEAEAQVSEDQETAEEAKPETEEPADEQATAQEASPFAGFDAEFQKFVAAEELTPVDVANKAFQFHRLEKEFDSGADGARTAISRMIAVAMENYGEDFSLDGQDVEPVRLDPDQMTPVEKALLARSNKLEALVRDLAVAAKEAQTKAAHLEHNENYGVIVKATYPDAEVDEKALAKFMSANKITDPLVAYRAMEFDSARTRAARQAFDNGVRSTTVKTPGQAVGQTKTYDRTKVDVAQELELLKQGYVPA